jgi:hypothetical protein
MLKLKTEEKKKFDPSLGVYLSESGSRRST